MAETFHETCVKKSRKERQCQWCTEMIEIGCPYRAYSFKSGSEFGRVELHPECYNTMQRIASDEGGWFEWTPGDYHRGDPDEI